MTDESKRMHILELIEKGDISSEEGIRRLQELNQAEEVLSSDGQGNADEESQIEARFDDNNSLPEDSGDVIWIMPVETDGFENERGASPGADNDDVETEWEPESDVPSGYYDVDEIRKGVEKWRRWWLIPLSFGVGISAVAGAFMLWTFQTAGFSFWFLCTSVFFVFGVVILVLAVQSRKARWLHLRVKQKPGERPRTIAFSFPLPLRLASWLMRVFGRLLPNMGHTTPEDIFMALNAVDETVSVENPIYINVDDEDGEKVEIFIG
jgi:hypothetical protein